MKTIGGIIVTTGFFISMTAHAAENCGSARVEGTECGKMSVIMDLAKCPGGQNEVTVKPKCKGDTGTATYKNGKNSYQVNIRKYVGQTGNVVWDIDGLIRTLPVAEEKTKKKESATPVVEAPVVVPGPANPAAAIVVTPAPAPITAPAPTAPTAPEAPPAPTWKYNALLQLWYAELDGPDTDASDFRIRRA